MKNLKKISKPSDAVGKVINGKADVVKKSEKLTSKTLAMKIQAKVNSSLSAIQAKSLLNRYKSIKKDNSNDALEERLSILEKLTGKGKNQLKTADIAKKVDVSVPQIYNLTKVNRLLNEKPAIKQYMKEYNIKVSEIMTLSRNKTADELLKTIKKYVSSGMIEPITPFLSKKMALAKKSSFTAKESKILYDELSDIINKHKKSKITANDKKSIVSFIEDKIS